jgi:hypothetical protein
LGTSIQLNPDDLSRADKTCVEYRISRKWLVVAATLLIVGLGSVLRQRYLILPSRVWRIGFMNAPPHYALRADGSPAGFVVEAVEPAMRRRGLRFEWKWVTESPEQVFRDGTIDIFPDLTDLPSRRKQNILFSAPWLQKTITLCFAEIERHFKSRRYRRTSSRV